MATRRVRGWRRRGSVLPSGANVAVIAVDAVAWYAGLLLDDRSLMAVAVGLALLLGVSLLIAIAQWVLLDAGDVPTIADVPSGLVDPADSPVGSSEDSPSDSNAVVSGVARRRRHRRWLLSLTRIRASRRAMRARRKSRATRMRTMSVHATGLIRRTLLPVAVRAQAQFERLDESGHVVNRYVGALPASRGWYRMPSQVVRWSDPFGLWRIVKPLRCKSSCVVLPQVEPMGNAADSAADMRMRGQTQTENAGTVRAYVPGDSRRMISWRQTAHRGTLMTRETGGDVRATTLLLLDPFDDNRLEDAAAGSHADSRGDADASSPMDAQVAAAMSRWKALDSSRSSSAGRDAKRAVVVMCGERHADRTADMLRLLASAGTSAAASDKAAAPDKAVQSDTDAASAGRTISAGRATDAARDAGDTRLSAAVAAVSATVRQLRMRGGIVTVTLFSTQPRSPFAAALRAASIGAPLRVHVVSAHDQAADGHPDGDQPRMTIIPLRDAAGSDAPGAVAHAIPASVYAAKRSPVEVPDGTAPSLDEAPRQSGIWPLTALALLSFLLTALDALTGIVAPGWWSWFAAVAMSALAVESSVPWRTPWRGTIRLIAYTASVLVTAVVLIVVRIHDATGVWLFFQQMMKHAPTEDDATAMMPISPWQALGEAFERGFDRLNVQLPPVSVDVYGDLPLIVVVALAAILLRCMLTWRRAAPVLALLTVVSYAAAFALVGRQVPMWQLALFMFTVAISLWSVRATPRSAIMPIMPVVSAALVAAITVSLTPSALSFAYAVPLSIGESKGLLSSNTINPMVDLKRSLVGGSSATVLRYRADGRRYLRMTTLDDFNGDTWSFDRDLAREGGFYGSGIQLGTSSKSSDGTRRNGWRRNLRYMVANPMLFYLIAYSDGMMSVEDGRDGGGYGDGGYRGDRYGGFGGSRRDDGGFAYDGSDESLDAFTDVQVTVESLVSRFLPVAGMPLSQSMQGDDDDSSDWVSADDGTIYARDRTTERGMTYDAFGIYLDPISKASDFTQVDAISRIRDQLVSMTGDTTTWSQRAELRRDLAARGYGTVHNGWLVIPLTMSGQYASDGYTDPDGQTVRTADGRSVGSIFFDSADDDGISFDDSFRSRLGLGDYEMIGMGIADNGDIAVAVALDESTGLSDGDKGADADASSDLNGGEDYADDGSDPDHSAQAQRSGSVLRTLSSLDYGGLLSYSGGLGDGGDDDNRYIHDMIDRITRNETSIRQRYRSLPEGLPEQVTTLVDQAKADGVPTGGDDASQQIAAMQWLVKYFTNPANGFTYSLTAPDGDGRDNMAMVAAFLDSRTGYCAHYASALAVLGRAMGVPTRLVLGYNAGSGEANDGGEYAVTASQLHSWVEAYIDGIGWVPFDVTPSSGDDAASTATQEPQSTQTETENPSATTITPQQQKTPQSESKTSDDDQSESDDTEKTAASTGNGAAATAFRLPQWAVIALWTLLGAALLAACASVPWLIRRIRSRRRFRLIAAADSGGGTGGGGNAGGGGGTAGNAHADVGAAHAIDDAWMAAWRELCDTAIDGGARWSGSDTEQRIAETMIAALDDGSFGGETRADDDRRMADGRNKSTERASALIRLAATQVSAISFGGLHGMSPDGLAQRLRDATATMRQAWPSVGVRQFIRRFIRRWIPASVFRPKR
ncbi:transglutaminaseTgpA domain-containing protein [Bifidobacterium jacchi]|nr:transglutaminaseTgpA domain-containing protein [Bifidobacterium jacchi]